MSLHPFFAEELVRKWSGHPSLFAKEDPASAPTLPGHGSPHPTKDKDMNDRDASTTPARPATSAYWSNRAADYEIALENVRRLAEVVDETISGHNHEQTAPGFIAVPADSLYQAYALLNAMQIVAKQALRAGR